MKRCRWFFDFDHTLYNTSILSVMIHQYLMALGSSKQEIVQTERTLNKTGYSFARHLEMLGYPLDVVRREETSMSHLLDAGNQILFPDVRRVLQALCRTDECNLLTFGDPTFQMREYAGATEIHCFITNTHFVWHDRSKGRVVAEYGSDCQTHFVDDSPEQLLSVAKHAPQAELFRMMWPQNTRTPHPLDNVRWRVVHSIEALLT